MLWVAGAIAWRQRHRARRSYDEKTFAEKPASAFLPKSHDVAGSHGNVGAIPANFGWSSVAGVGRKAQWEDISEEFD